jgi:hypothetical protein
LRSWDPHQMIPGVKIGCSRLCRHTSTSPRTSLGSGLMLTGLPTGSGWACMSKLYRGVAEVELQVLELKKRPTPASFHVIAVVRFGTF